MTYLYLINKSYIFIVESNTMQIGQLYKAKVIAILNVESIIGKVLLRKILLEYGQHLNKIIIIDTHIRTEPVDTNKLYEQLI